jgi:hypothetical protein
MMITPTGHAGAAAGTCLACGYVNATADRVTGAMACGGCGERITLTYVRGAYNERIPCDDRCQYAVGPQCSCACGGRNHRAGYIRAELVPVYIRERDAQRHAERLSRAAAKAAATRTAHAAAKAALLEEHPGLGGLLSEQYDGAYGFMADMRAALQRGDMTPRQIAAALTALADDAARAAAAAAREAEHAALVAAGVQVTEGKQTVQGEIVRVSTKQSYFGGREQTVWQIMVKLADGCKVMGSLPSALAPGSYTGGDENDEGSWAWHMGQLVGRQVQFNATVTRSDRDQTFGFYSRPTRATFTAPA